MPEDRILDEVHATGGDVRRLMELFGLTATSAQRYTATLDPQGLTGQADREPNGSASIHPRN